MYELTKRVIVKDVFTIKQQLIETLIKKWHHNLELLQITKVCRIELMISAKGCITKYTFYYFLYKIKKINSLVRNLIILLCKLDTPEYKKYP